MGKPLYHLLLSGLLTAVSALSLTACPQSLLVGEVAHQNPTFSTPEPSSSPARLTQLPAAAAEPDAAFEVCADLPGWQRSPETAHLKELQEMPRYGSAIESEPLKSLLQDFWSHQVFSFTTYGLSARTEPIYLSGVWTALDDIWSCYDGSQPEQINNGDRAEVWLINHQAVDLQWSEGRYLLTVEPSGSGLQLIQFDRQESSAALPLVVVTTGGETIEVLSGDW
ncbi:MAG: hypothetical protein ICV62_08675 [Cyanobacteria bacterium Co-bin13]|nr:hypothetical protein [Cyanobacteria bacterium Co-bin13]